MKRRLYLQIYLTFVGILVLFCVLLSLAWMFVPHGAEELRAFEGAEAVLGELLPGPRALKRGVASRTRTAAAEVAVTSGRTRTPWEAACRRW